MKAKTNNPNGRPKGTGNALAASLREQIRNGVSTNGVIENMFTRLEEIADPFKYVQTALSIIDLILPRLPQEAVQEPEQRSIASIFETVMAKIEASQEKTKSLTGAK